MDNRQKYNYIFRSELGLEEDFDEEKIRAYKTENWDSVGHMSLITAIEDAFDIMFDPEDILALDSYVRGIEILKKYDVVI